MGNIGNRDKEMPSNVVKTSLDLSGKAISMPPSRMDKDVAEPQDHSMKWELQYVEIQDLKLGVKDRVNNTSEAELATLNWLDHLNRFRRLQI